MFLLFSDEEQRADVPIVGSLRNVPSLFSDEEWREEVPILCSL